MTIRYQTFSWTNYQVVAMPPFQCPKGKELYTDKKIYMKENLRVLIVALMMLGTLILGVLLFTGIV